MSNPASISGVDLTTPQGRQILQDALDVLYGLIQKAGGTAAGPTTFDELRVRMLTVLGTINVVPEDKPPANVNSRLVTPWLTGQRGRGEVWRFEDQNDGGDLLEVRSQPYLIGTPSATAGDWEFRFYSAQRDPAGAYRSLGAIRFGSTGRIRTYDASEVLLFDSTLALTAANAPLPKRYVEGLVIRYASSSTITVSAGKARDKADGADMTLSSGATVSTGTANAALGYERKTLTGTATWTNLSASVTGSSTAFLTEFGTRALSVGTIGTGGVALSTITGTGTKFLSEVAVYDLIGNSSVGYAQVTAIASDTSLSIRSNLTIANLSTGNVIEQPTIESAGGKRHSIHAIASNTALTLSSSASGTETGVAAYATSGLLSPTGTAVWRAVWLLSGGSGTTVALSTQRTTPYLSITGYTTSYRRIGWVLIDSSGNLVAQYGTDGGCRRWVNYETSFGDLQGVANASSTTTYQDVVLSNGAPPTAYRLQIMLLQLSPNTVDYVMVRGRGLGSTAARVRSVLAPTTSTESRLVFDTPCDGAQVIQHRSNTSTTGDGTYIDLTAYEDTLE